MECLAHVISGSSKAGVVDVKSEDGLLDTSNTRAIMNKNIMWTKESQKSAAALVKAQKNCKLEIFRLLAPAKNNFSYILHSFKILLINKDSDKYWEVVCVVVQTMEEVVAGVHKNELVGRRWLLSNAVMEIVGL